MSRLITSLFALSFLSSLSHVSKAQDTAHIRETGSLIQSIESSLDTLQMEMLDLTNSHPDSGYGILMSHSDETYRILRLANNLRTHDGGSIKTIFYFNDNGELVAKSEVSRYPGELPIWHYSENTTFFKNGAMEAEQNRSVDYNANRPFDPNTIAADTIASTEFDSSWVTESFEDATIRAEQVKRLVNYFNKQNGLPSNLLLDSVSPFGEFGVCWNVANPDELTANYYLADLQNGFTPMIELGGGLQPGANHAYQWTAWEETNSRYFVFGMDGKWTTIDAALYKIEDNRSVNKVGNLYEDALQSGWDALVAQNHPFAREGEGLYGAIRIASISEDGGVHFELNTESKMEGPENNVCSEMVISYHGDGTAKSLYFRTKQIEEPLAYRFPKESTEEHPALPVDDAEPAVVITNRNAGPIDSGTPFNIKVIRKLFPDYKVVTGTESFEEGGEQPVIHVIHEGAAILTLVPVLNEAKLGWLYTTSPSVATQLGFTPGDAFGEIFESIPPETYIEGISGEVLVAVPGMPCVTFRFEPHDPAQTDTTDLPPYQSLQNWILYSIEWTPGV